MMKTVLKADSTEEIIMWEQVTKNESDKNHNDGREEGCIQTKISHETFIIYVEVLIEYVENGKDSRLVDKINY